MELTATAVIAVGCGVLGLLIGSFLNVVVYRLPRSESLLRPASHCPACNAAIRARHNLPVLGWLMLRGRCADCRTPISARYPLVEAATGGVFALLGALFADSWALPALLYLAAAGMVLALIDLDTRRLPTIVVGSSFAVVLLLLVGASAGEDAWAALGRGLVGAAISYGAFLLIAMAWPGAMGGGDIRLAALLGLATAWIGWGALIVGLFLGFFLGAVTGVGLMTLGRAHRRTALPFGPFMIVGAFIGIVLGNAAIDAYLGLLPGAT